MNINMVFELYVISVRNRVKFHNDKTIRRINNGL